MPAGRTATALSAGRNHTCAILDGGDVLCWGDRYAVPGQVEDIGDDEPASSAPAVDIGGEQAVAISAGYASVCVLTEAGNVWCWGSDGGVDYLGLGGNVVTPTKVDFVPSCPDFAGHCLAKANQELTLAR